MTQTMHWPEGQIFPTFGTPAANMDGFSPVGQTKAMQILLSALQGIVNAAAPRIFMIDEKAGEGGRYMGEYFRLYLC